MSQLIYKNGCWGCQRALEDPTEKYICPKYQEHLIAYQKPIQFHSNLTKLLIST